MRATFARLFGFTPSKFELGFRILAQTIDTVVIGAGPAGLAVGACLRAKKLPFVQFERAAALAPAWRRHYDRLHLHTVRWHSGLPMRSMPADYPKYPSRQQMVDYFDDYARAFGLEPQLGVSVDSVLRGQDGWTVHTGAGAWVARNIVVASGYNRVPNLPEIPGLEQFGGPVLHTSVYQNGANFRDKNVLVMGCGNSGAEIALDLFEHGAKTWLVVRGPVHVAPRDFLGRGAQETSIMLSRLPVWLADRLAWWTLRFAVGDLSEFGIYPPKKGPIRMVLEHGRVSMLDIGTLSHIRTGEILVVPAVTTFSPGSATFADGRVLPFDAVVLATGFRAGLAQFLDGADQLTNARGLPTTHGDPAAAGLYFTGFRNPPTGALREIALEAPRIAASIAGH